MRHWPHAPWIAGPLLCLLLAGCAGDVKELRAFLEQARVRQPVKAVAGQEYRVLPPDALAITSLQVAEVNGVRQQVRPDGFINLPLIGEIYVAGKTPAEIQGLIAERAKTYYEYDNLDIIVDVVGYNSQKIYVFGQVSRPGPIPWTGTNSLLDVLAQAQPTQLAWPQRIRLVRGKPPTKGGYMPDPPEGGAGWQPLTYTPEGGADGSAGPTTAPATAPDETSPAADKPEAKTMTVNMMDMVKSGDMSRNVMLYPDDVVYVPANPFAEVGLALQSVLFPVRPVLEAVRVPSEVENAGSSSNDDNE